MEGNFDRTKTEMGEQLATTHWLAGRVHFTPLFAANNVKQVVYHPETVRLIHRLLPREWLLSKLNKSSNDHKF